MTTTTLAKYEVRVWTLSATGKDSFQRFDHAVLAEAMKDFDKAANSSMTTKATLTMNFPFHSVLRRHEMAD